MRISREPSKISFF